MAEAPPSAPRRSLRDVPWVWVGVALVMVFALVRQLVRDEPSHPLVGTPVPEALSLPLAEPGGDRMRLADLRGGVVLLEFWATWCKACRASTPSLNALAERYGGRGLTLLGINTDAPDASLAAAGHRSFGAGFPSLYDPLRKAQAAFDVRALPTLVLIDTQGVVRRVSVGVPDEQQWAGWIRELL